MIGNIQEMRLDGIDQLIIGKVSQEPGIFFSELRRGIPEIPESTLYFRVKNLLLDGRLEAEKHGNRLALRPAA